MKKTNKKGFTIVELVIVIAVIAILAGVLIPTFSSVVTKANQSKALQAARNEFTEAYALAIADDGKISADDDGVAVSSDNLTITTTNFVFTINKTTYDIISVAGSASTTYTDYITYVSGKMAGV